MTLTLTTNQSVDRSVFDEQREGLTGVAPIEARAIPITGFRNLHLPRSFWPIHKTAAELRLLTPGGALSCNSAISSKVASLRTHSPITTI